MAFKESDANPFTSSAVDGERGSDDGIGGLSRSEKSIRLERTLLGGVLLLGLAYLALTGSFSTSRQQTLATYRILRRIIEWFPLLPFLLGTSAAFACARRWKRWYWWTLFIAGIAVFAAVPCHYLAYGPMQVGTELTADGGIILRPHQHLLNLSRSFMAFSMVAYAWGAIGFLFEVRNRGDIKRPPGP